MKFKSKVLSTVIAGVMTVMSFGGVMPKIFNAGNEMVVSAATFVPRKTEPSLSDPNYTSDNVFYKSDCGMPNCTCYAYGRAKELLGYEPSLSHGNAYEWYGHDDGYARGSEPKLGAIACWNHSGGGHVAVVEEIEGDTVWLSESSWGGAYFNYVSKNKNNMGNCGVDGGYFQGYIYIGDWITKNDLTVSAGYSSSNTEFTWNQFENAKYYNLRIWKDKLWDGDDFYTEWDCKNNKFGLKLPSGTYFAYVDVVYADETVEMTNVVEFKVEDGTPLAVSGGYSSSNTEFTWNQVENAKHYNLRIWKDELWKGDNFHTEWECEDTKCDLKLPVGTYFAYVDVVFNDETVKMSNVVEFTVEDGTMLAVSAGYSNSNTTFSWDKVENAKHYNLRIWKDVLWEGDDFYTEWGCEDTKCALELPVGTYFAYIDVVFNDETVKMSNAVEFKVEDGLNGDCNDDGIISTADIVTLKKWLLNIENTKININAADFNQNGSVDILDFIMLKTQLLS